LSKYPSSGGLVPAVFLWYITQKPAHRHHKTHGNRIKQQYWKKRFMSKKHPECPLYNPYNCKEYNNPTLCAFVKEDKKCLKKKKPKANPKANNKKDE
jgi:hypothetical protein